jgi:hypothetical protein
VSHWTNPRRLRPTPRRPYDELGLHREQRDAEKMADATAKAVEARHPSAYNLWALMDIRPERVEPSELREGVPPHLRGTI